MTDINLEPTLPDGPKRVLVVDDSFIMRRLVTEIIESDPDFKVVDTAENGKVALQKVRLVKPDLIILDIEMPEMSGFEALRRLGLRSNSKVVILSFRAAEGSAEAIEARRLGAADVLQKPSGSVSLDLNVRLGSELITRLRRVMNLTPRVAPSGGEVTEGEQVRAADTENTNTIRDLIRSKEVLLANLAEGVLMFDNHLRVTAVNAAAQRILRRPNLSPGDELVDLFADYNLDIGDKVRAALASNESILQIESEFADDSGDWVPLRLSIVVAPPESGTGPGILMLFEDISRERSMRQMLEQTASRDIASNLLLSGSADLGGSLVRSTILFSDIRSFTSMAERLSAAVIVDLLNEYFSFMEDVITSEGGAVDKYIGDAIMALFGVPQASGNDPKRACRAALRMMSALELFNGGRDEQARIRIGIGIATGDVIAGYIGSPSRLNYTVIGDPVNMASRMESLTKVYGAPVLVCEQTRAALGDEFVVRDLDRIRVRGQQTPNTLFEVLATDPSAVPSAWLQNYQAGRTAYEAGNYSEALEHFTSARRSRIDDKAAALMVERCRRLMKSLPDGWDGVWQMD